MEIPTLPNKYTYTRQSQQWFTLSFPAWWCYSLIHIHAHRWINLEVNCMRCDWHCHQRIFNTHKICVLHSHIQHTRVFPHFVCSTSKYFWVKFIFVSRLYFACMFCTHISASLFNDAVFFFYYSVKHTPVKRISIWWGCFLFSYHVELLNYFLENELYTTFVCFMILCIFWKFSRQMSSARIISKFHPPKGFFFCSGNSLILVSIQSTKEYTKGTQWMQRRKKNPM